MNTPSSPPIPPLAWGLLGLLALLWGTSFLGNRFALQGIGPISIVAFRVVGAAVLLWIVALGLGRSLPRDPWLVLHFIIIGFLNCGLPFSLIAWGQKFIPSGLTGILNAGAAVFGVAVAALLLRDERLTPRRALGVAIGFAGVILAIGPAALTALDPASVGQFAIVGSSICYAFGAAYTRLRTSALPPEIAAAGMLTGAAICQIPMMLIFEGVPAFDWPGSVSLALLWLTVCCTALAYLIYFRVLALAGAGNTSLVTLIIPPVAIIAGAIVFGERLTVNELAGFAVIAIGLMILNGWPKTRDRAPDKPRDGARPAR